MGNCRLQLVKVTASRSLLTNDTDHLYSPKSQQWRRVVVHRSEAVLLAPSTLPVGDAMDYVGDNFGAAAATAALHIISVYCTWA